MLGGGCNGGALRSYLLVLLLRREVGALRARKRQTRRRLVLSESGCVNSSDGGPRIRLAPPALLLDSLVGGS